MSDEERVRALLGEVFAVDPPTTAGLTEERVRSSHRRRRASAAGVSALVLVVAAVLVVPGLAGARRASGPAQAVATPTPRAASTSGPASSPSVSAPSPSVATAPVVLPARPLVDGDIVGANGGVVAIPGRPVRWCPGGFDTDESFVLYSPGGQPPAQWCAVGVDVTGVDLDRLALRRTSKGVVWGYAYLRGTWRHGTVDVTLQTEQRLDQVASPRWTTPPCPESAVGSLPVGPATNPDAVESTIQRWSDHHPGEIVTTVQFRPTPTRAVMVVAAAHPDLVRAALHLKPSELCVVQANSGKAQLDAAQAPFETSMRAKNGGQLLVTQLSQSVDERAQPTVNVQVAWWTPQLAALPPSDVVHVSAWLSPIAADAPLPPAIPTSPVPTSAFSTATGNTTFVATSPTAP